MASKNVAADGREQDQGCGAKIGRAPKKPKPPRRRAPETPDAPLPLLDLSDAAVKKMIKQAKKRGYVTYEQLNAVMPSEEVTSEKIEDILAMMSEMGINVVETEEADAEEEDDARGGRRGRIRRRRTGRGDAQDASQVGSARARRAHRRSGAHVFARNGLGRTAVARRRNRHRQAHRGRPRSHDRRTVREPAVRSRPSSSGATSSTKEKSSSATSSISKRPMRARRQGHAGRRPGGRSGRRSHRQWRRSTGRRHAVRAAAADRGAAVGAACRHPVQAAGRSDGEEGGEEAAIADADMDEDDLENSMSLAAIEAELKPKVLETFDNIADCVQAAAPAARPGHSEQAAFERGAVARAGAQIQEAQGRDHPGGEIAAAQSGAHRFAGRAALRHQQAAGQQRGPPDAARREPRRGARGLPAALSGLRTRSALAQPRLQAVGQGLEVARRPGQGAHQGTAHAHPHARHRDRARDRRIPQDRAHGAERRARGAPGQEGNGRGQSAARHLHRQEIHQPRPAVPRSDPGRQYRPDEGGR